MPSSRSYAHLDLDALEGREGMRVEGIADAVLIFTRSEIDALIQRLREAEALLLGTKGDPKNLPGMLEIGKRLIAFGHVVDRYARHDQLCHALDRESLATHERVCTCGLEDALATVDKGK